MGSKKLRANPYRYLGANYNIVVIVKEAQVYHMVFLRVFVWTRIVSFSLSLFFFFFFSGFLSPS